MEGSQLLRVSEIELDNAVSAGISLRTLGPDTVPPHEEHEARLERGIRLAEWAAMDMFEKALIIANRRTRIAIENLQADAEIKRAKQAARGQRNAKSWR